MDWEAMSFGRPMQKLGLHNRSAKAQNKGARFSTNLSEDDQMELFAKTLVGNWSKRK